MSLITFAYSCPEAKSHGVTEIYEVQREKKNSAICEYDAELCYRFAPRPC